MKRSEPVASSLAASPPRLRWIGVLLGRIGVALLLFVLLYQIPAKHNVHVGYNDAAYVQGFNDPVNRWGVIDEQSKAATPLRWTKAQSYLLFPQIGLPAEATIRWRGLRGDDAPPVVRVLLNGKDELGVFQTTGEWETHTFRIDSGLTKANDVFLELRTDPVVEDEGLVRGVQVDYAALTTTTWPIMPYPAQLFYGTAAIVLGLALVSGYRLRISFVLAVGLAFLLLYRLQLTPYPLRSLPPLLVAVLAAAFAVRRLPAIQPLVLRLPWVTLPLSLTAVWLAWLLLTAQQHVTLSVPGVERDFPVFATRATALFCNASAERATEPCVLRADGFYQIGYPLLLWIAKSLAGLDAFIAAHIIAAVSSGIFIVATAALAWRFAPETSRRVGAVLAVLIAAFSPFVVQYGLYVGTDMPFAAMWIASLALLFVPIRHNAWSVAAAGAVAAFAFLVRHPGLVLLPIGWITLFFLRGSAKTEHGYSIGSNVAQAFTVRAGRHSLFLWFTAGWLLVALPQIVINIRDMGSPFYSHQAKNIWLAVYGNTDYSGRWAEAIDDVQLSDLVLADPARFFGNWSRNIRIFVGTGAEDTSEFGQALALRLLHFPANWLALSGLTLILWRGTNVARLLIAAAVLYVAGVSVGFVLPRFFLPLAPIWSVAATIAVLNLVRHLSDWWPRLDRTQWQVSAAFVLTALMLRGPQIGARFVLDHQDPNATAVIQTLLPQLRDTDRIRFILPSNDTLGRYSALAPFAAAESQSDARYIVWSSRVGEQPVDLQSRPLLAQHGPYSIWAQE